MARRSRLAATETARMRTMFAVYVLVIVAGLVVYISVGLANA